MDVQRCLTVESRRVAVQAGNLCNVISRRSSVTPIPKRNRSTQMTNSNNQGTGHGDSKGGQSGGSKAGSSERGGSHEQHVKAGEQSHKNDAGKSGGSGSYGSGSSSGSTSGSRSGNK